MVVEHMDFIRHKKCNGFIDCFQENSKKDERKSSKHQLSGLLKVWLGMQTTICGQPAISQEKIDRFTHTNSLGIYTL